MNARRSAGWIDIIVRGETVGFIVVPSKRGGKWHAYLDMENANSKRVGSASTEEEAREMVRRAAS